MGCSFLGFVREPSSASWTVITVVSSLVVLGCSKRSPGSDGAANNAPSEAKESDSENESLATKALQRYLTPTRCTDRLETISNPQGDRAALTEFYASNKCSGEYESLDAKSCRYPLDDGYCDIDLVFKSKERVTYCLVKTGSEFKVDWRCSAAYNPVSIPAFRAQHALRKPSLFRVIAKLDDYYNYEFSDARETHYSISLKDDYSESISGYIPRSSPDGQKLFDTLKDGKSRAVIVELAYLSNSSPKVATITRLIGFTWRERPEEYGR